MNKEIIKEVLAPLALYSDNAEALLLGIAATETNFGHFRRQLGFENRPLKQGGLGIYQMELATANSILYDYLLTNNHSLYKMIINLKDADASLEQSLMNNDNFATGMCRCFFLRFNEPIPNKLNVTALACYWKKYYNTSLGKGSIDVFIEKYNKYVANGNE